MSSAFRPILLNTAVVVALSVGMYYQTFKKCLLWPNLAHGLKARDMLLARRVWFLTHFLRYDIFVVCMLISRMCRANHRPLALLRYRADELLPLPKPWGRIRLLNTLTSEIAVKNHHLKCANILKTT